MTPLVKTISDHPAYFVQGDQTHYDWTLTSGWEYLPIRHYISSLTPQVLTPDPDLWVYIMSALSVNYPNLEATSWIFRR